MEIETDDMAFTAALEQARSEAMRRLRTAPAFVLIVRCEEGVGACVAWPVAEEGELDETLQRTAAELAALL